MRHRILPLAGHYFSVACGPSHSPLPLAAGRTSPDDNNRPSGQYEQHHHGHPPFGYSGYSRIALVGNTVFVHVDGLSATGDIASVPGIEDDLLKEAEEIEEDMGAYFEYWPILSLGLKIPFG